MDRIVVLENVMVLVSPDLEKILVVGLELRREGMRSGVMIEVLAFGQPLALPVQMRLSTERDRQYLRPFRWLIVRCAVYVVGLHPGEASALSSIFPSRPL